MEITYKQRLWLRTRGGRGISDVYWKDGKPFIEMTNHFEGDTIILPEDQYINLFMNEFGYVQESSQV